LSDFFSKPYLAISLELAIADQGSLITDH